MPSARELGDAFFSGSLLGTKSNNPYGRKASPSNGLTPSVFDDKAYEAATKAGYSNKDINRFLQDSGTKATGAMFQVAGMQSYATVQGTKDSRYMDEKESLYWQVTPGFTPTPTPAAPAAAAPVAATPAATPAVAAPASGNTILQTIGLPNNGIGTIESVSAPASAPAPILGNPLGEDSQRVQREKAKLSIAR